MGNDLNQHSSYERIQISESNHVSGISIVVNKDLMLGTF